MTLRDEAGQTLPELMIATVIGLIVVFAAFLALQTSITQNNRIQQREDASQRGRIALEVVSRELRAEVCIDGLHPPIVYGDGNTVTFTSDLTGNKLPPMQRTISYVKAPTGSPANAPGKLVEQDYNGVNMPPATTYLSTPTRTFTILDKVVPVAGAPVFQYFQFAATGTPGLDPTPLATPLADVDRGQAVDVRVSFLARGTASANGNPNAYGSSFQDDVYTRVADPTAPRLGTNCN